jgi:hypothetical protein
LQELPETETPDMFARPGCVVQEGDAVEKMMIAAGITFLFGPAAVGLIRALLLRYTECTREEAYLAAFVAGGLLMLAALHVAFADPSASLH